MTQPNTPKAADILAAITKADHALHVAFYRGRSAQQAAARLSRIREQNESRDDKHPHLAEDMAEAVGLAETIAEAVEEVAATLPDVRALRAAMTGGLETAQAPKVADAGMAIVVQYRGPTIALGPRWTARHDRDSKTVFRASSHYTYDDKDKDGADLAAAACLAKFEDYCNKPIPGVIKTSQTRFALTARASLGRGAYAYTFSRV